MKRNTHILTVFAAVIGASGCMAPSQQVGDQPPPNAAAAAPAPLAATKAGGDLAITAPPSVSKAPPSNSSVEPHLSASPPATVAPAAPSTPKKYRPTVKWLGDGSLHSFCTDSASKRQCETFLLSLGHSSNCYAGDPSACLGDGEEFALYVADPKTKPNWKEQLIPVFSPNPGDATVAMAAGMVYVPEQRVSNFPDTKALSIFWRSHDSQRDTLKVWLSQVATDWPQSSIYQFSPGLRLLKADSQKDDNFSHLTYQKYPHLDFTRSAGKDLLVAVRPKSNGALAECFIPAYANSTFTITVKNECYTAKDKKFLLKGAPKDAMVRFFLKIEGSAALSLQFTPQSTPSPASAVVTAATDKLCSDEENILKGKFVHSCFPSKLWNEHSGVTPNDPGRISKPDHLEFEREYATLSLPLDFFGTLPNSGKSFQWNQKIYSLDALFEKNLKDMFNQLEGGGGQFYDAIVGLNKDISTRAFKKYEAELKGSPKTLKLQVQKEKQQ